MALNESLGRSSLQNDLNAINNFLIINNNKNGTEALPSTEVQEPF